MTDHKPIDIIIIGGSFAGLSALKRLESYNLKFPHKITVIEPKTCFEFTPTIWDLLPRANWTLPITNELSNHQHYIQSLQHIENETNEMFLDYTTLPLLSKPDITFTNGLVTSIETNTITYQPIPSFDDVTQQSINPITLHYNILFNCTGSNALQPIKQNTQNYSIDLILKMFNPNYTTIDELLNALFTLFYTNDLSILDTIPHKLRFSLQSLLYLPESYIYLLFHCFIGQTNISTTDYQLYRAFVLICFILPTTPTQLLTIIQSINVEKRDNIISNIFSKFINKQGKSTLQSKPYNNRIQRFIELAAIEAMLKYITPTNDSQNQDPINTNINTNTTTNSSLTHTSTTPTSTSSSTFSTTLHILPQVNYCNFIGGGVTAIELFGNFLDVYYNHNQKSAIQQPIPQFHMYAPTILDGFPLSIQNHAKQHYIHTYKDTTIEFHEDDFWAPAIYDETVKKQLELDPNFNKYSILNFFCIGVTRSHLGTEAAPSLLTTQSMSQFTSYIDQFTLKDDNQSKTTEITESTETAQQSLCTSILTEMPGLVFTIGDANPLCQANARNAHSTANIAVDNAILFINEFLSTIITQPNRFIRIANNQSNTQEENDVDDQTTTTTATTITTTESEPTPTSAPSTTSKTDTTDTKEKGYYAIQFEMMCKRMISFQYNVNSIACFHLGQFGGSLGSSTWDLYKLIPFNGSISNVMKTIVRRIIMNVFTDTTFASTIWNTMESILSTFEWFM